MLRKCCLLILGVWINLSTAGFAAPALKALIVDGRMNMSHDYRGMLQREDIDAFVKDDEANRYLKRQQREGFEIRA